MRYVLTDLAEQDLLEIATYIAEDSLDAAERLLAEFAAAFD